MNTTLKKRKNIEIDFDTVEDLSQFGSENIIPKKLTRNIWSFCFQIKKSEVDRLRHSYSLKSFVSEFGSGFNDKSLVYAYCAFESNEKDSDSYFLKGRISFQYGKRYGQVSNMFPNAKINIVDDPYYFCQKNRISDLAIFGELSPTILQLVKTRESIDPFNAKKEDILSYFAGFFDGGTLTF